jgi:hypothetical protein
MYLYTLALFTLFDILVRKNQIHLVRHTNSALWRCTQCTVNNCTTKQVLPLEVPNEVFLFFLLTLFMLSHVVVVLCSCCPFALVVPFVKWYYFQVFPCSLFPVFRWSHVLVILWSLCLLFMSTLLYVTYISSYLFGDSLTYIGTPWHFIRTPWQFPWCFLGESGTDIFRELGGPFDLFDSKTTVF